MFSALYTQFLKIILVIKTFWCHGTFEVLVQSVLQYGSHWHIKGRRNIQYKILTSIFFSLNFWLKFGGLEDEPKQVLVSAHPRSTIRQKLPRTETGITQPFYKGHQGGI